MLNYIIRRLFYAIPILIGVNLITFTLFFVVNTPDDMARMQLGIKRVTPEAIARWKQERGYDKPLMFNNAEQGVDKLTRTVFFEKSIAMFAFRHANKPSSWFCGSNTNAKCHGRLKKCLWMNRSMSDRKIPWPGWV